MDPSWVALAELAKMKAEERRKDQPELKRVEFGTEQTEAQAANGSTGGISATADFIESQRWRAAAFNSNPGTLTGYDCRKCRNRGYSTTTDEEGHLITVPCECMTIRRNQQRIEQSGLSDLLSRYTFERWSAAEDWQRVVLDGAKRYAAAPSGWFAISGKPGTGKTHICTAICGALMKQGIEVRYMLWRDASTRMKAYSLAEAAAYTREIEPLKRVQCLYVDDLFKTGKKQGPTDMDVNLAFEIINARYNTNGLLTIISSERTLDELMRIDEAIASRIYERTKAQRNYYNLAGKENWRMRERGTGNG